VSGLICQLRELRAVDQRWIYRLRDPDNWDPEKWASIDTHLWFEMVKAVAGDDSIESADFAHEAWRRIFGELGMHYWRMPWADCPHHNVARHIQLRRIEYVGCVTQSC